MCMGRRRSGGRSSSSCKVARGTNFFPLRNALLPLLGDLFYFSTGKRKEMTRSCLLSDGKVALRCDDGGVLFGFGCVEAGLGRNSRKEADRPAMPLRPRHGVLALSPKAPGCDWTSLVADPFFLYAYLQNTRVVLIRSAFGDVVETWNPHGFCHCKSLGRRWWI